MFRNLLQFGISNIWLWALAIRGWVLENRNAVLHGRMASCSCCWIVINVVLSSRRIWGIDSSTQPSNWRPVLVLRLSISFRIIAAVLARCNVWLYFLHWGVQNKHQSWMLSELYRLQALVLVWAIVFLLLPLWLSWSKHQAVRYENFEFLVYMFNLHVPSYCTCVYLSLHVLLNGHAK